MSIRASSFWGRSGYHFSCPQSNMCVCVYVLSKGFWCGGSAAFFLSHYPACKREIYCSVDGLRQSQVHRPQPRIEGDGLGPGWDRGRGRGWGLWVSLLTFKMPHNGHSLATGCSHSNLYASPACDTNKFAHICPGGQSICNSDDFLWPLGIKKHCCTLTDLMNKRRTAVGRWAFSKWK